jgi:hypothetical protein
MTSHALNAYEKQSPSITEHVWFMGTGALLEGQAVCYNFDFGTAADVDGRRGNRVEPPSTTNNLYFAGVAARDYPANAAGATRPQLIEIYTPGSWCNVRSAASTTLGVGRLTFDITAVVATNGLFKYEGLEGEGSCVPLQTVDRSSTAGLCFARLDPPGRPSGGVETVQLVDATAFVAMVGGTTNVIGVAAGTSSPAEEILDGTKEGQRKKFEVITTAVTTNECRINIENDDGNDPADGTQDLDGVEIGAVGDQVVFEWAAGSWNIVGKNGITLAT